jgi:aspartate/methionine/tyrosine aminotransferase
LLILNYPGNPEGSTYTSDELEALAAIAKEHKLIILSDEIYGRLHHDGDHISIARYYSEGTIVSSGTFQMVRSWRMAVRPLCVSKGIILAQRCHGIYRQ